VTFVVSSQRLPSAMTVLVVSVPCVATREDEAFAASEPSDAAKLTRSYKEALPETVVLSLTVSVVRTNSASPGFRQATW
jgi:hypothetical protein